MIRPRQLLVALLAFAVCGWAMGPADLSAAKETKKERVLPAGATSARNPLPLATLIDREVEKRLAEAKVPASPVADDAEFLRRLSLDVRGRIPTAERTAAFLADTDPDKRRKLIDEFLADPEYGEHFGIIWYHRMVKPSNENRQVISADLRDYLAERFNRNVGWDRIVSDILTADGDREANPAAVFWLAHLENKRFLPPERVNASVSHLFLGIKLECCECHNHPFDTLKQTDFWGMTAFFTQTHMTGAAKKNQNATPGVAEGGQFRAGKGMGARDKPPVGSVTIPDSNGKVVKARFLLGETPNLDGKKPLRPVLAAWLTSPSNPYFARAAVNKMWANFFARGLVNPVDDMRPDNPNTHPAILSALAEEFTASGFDLKHLIRCICNSKTYQRTSVPLSANKADEELYSHGRLRAMTADMLFDSLTVALAHEPAGKADARGKGMGMKRKLENGVREGFRKFFNAEADDDAGVVEEYSHGIPQALRLMNSHELNNTNTVVANLMKTEAPEKVIEGIYLRVLSRRPTAAEVGRLKEYVAGAKDPARGYADAMWVLLNGGEFVFNH
jgi:hypothetical protein